MSIESELADEIIKFRNDPLNYVKFVFPWGKGVLKEHKGPDKWQTDVLKDLAEYSAKCDKPGDLAPFMEAIASGHGIGKTCLLSWIIKWFMSTRPHPQVIVTANTMEQLNSKTWRELAKWNKLAIDGHWFEWTATRFYYKKHPETWFANAIPWSENNSEAFAGTHETDVLVIFDEASKISDKIWEVTDGAMTTRGAMWLAFGNPTQSKGRFYDCFYKYQKYWKTRHIDSRDSNVANKVWCQQIIDMYGENDDRTKTRVYGQFPTLGEKQLISGAAIEKAATYEAEGFEYQPLLLGIDVARFGTCETILQFRQGRKVYEPIICPTMDLMQTAAFAAETMSRRKPMVTTVDEIGIGAGVLDRLRQLGFSVLGGNSGNMSENPRYLNKRAEAYFSLKEYVEAGCELPKDKLLIEDLRMLSYDFTDKGRLRIDRKQDFIDDFGRSPDRGDALSLTFFYPHGNIGVMRHELEPEAFMDS
jgi:hypothetical protein